ncbi:LOW QUALITY PROTEIN: uncharacterized protein EMH_0011350 [Eimeria mitis]|uniref:Uncharacterized protein n=1 Tax=Eimeria mitis TaxID=44415 RepID=U6JV40_9EIME|nr:LOW QUALITY PROTEIN: uncharacterized protein EMH_0011350 [Eimeria mitis]CDJ27917.1 hypothetical protein EMH_0011350 [Eimeria mitis]
MRAAAAAELRTLPTSVQQADWSDNGWEVASGEVVLPIISRILPQKRNVSVGGLSVSAVALAALPQKRNVSVGGLSVSAVALAAVASVTAVYLVLRCAVYLANASKSRVALRLLSSAEKTTDKGAGEPCRASGKKRPTAAATVSASEEAGALGEQDLLKRAQRYITELKQFIKNSEPLVRELSPGRMAKYTISLLCLSLVEISALYSMLERDERAGIVPEVSKIYNEIWAYRRSLGREHTTKSRERHFKYLHLLLGKLKDAKPVETALAKKQRLLRLNELLQLQEVALGQLNTGLVLLRESLEGSNDPEDIDKAANVAGEGTPSAAERTAAAAGDPGVADVAEDDRSDEIVRDIQTTVHERRRQVLSDPLLSSWLREVHTPDFHYGIIRSKCLEEIAQQPPKSHQELLEDLRKTPLGSADGHWSINIKESDEEQGTKSPSETDVPFTRDDISPPESQSRAPRALRTLDTIGQGSRKGAGPNVISASPSTPTAAAAAAAAAAAVPTGPAPKGKYANLRAQRQHKIVHSRAAPNIRWQVSQPGGAGRPRFSATSAAPHPAALPSARRHVPHAEWPTNVSAVTSVRRSPSPSSPPEALPKPPRDSFNAAISAAAAYAIEAFTLRTPGAAAKPSGISPGFGASPVSVPEHGSWPAAAASYLSPAASAPQQAGFDSVPRASGPRHRAYSPSSFHLDAPSSSGCRRGAAVGTRPLQRRFANEGAPPGTGKLVSTPSASRWHLPTSQPLSPSPWLPAEYRLASGTAGQESSQENDTWPFTSRVWGPLGTAPPVTGVGYFPTEGPDEPSHPEASSEHAQLAKRLEATPDQQLGEATPPWHPLGSTDPRN